MNNENWPGILIPVAVLLYFFFTVIVRALVPKAIIRKWHWLYKVVYP